MSGKTSSTIDRPETPPSAADRGRSRLGDLSRPIRIDRRITHHRRSNVALALVALMIAGALAAAIFVLPVKTMFDQDDQIAERDGSARRAAGGQQRPAQRGRPAQDRRRDQGGGARAARIRRARRDPPVDPRVPAGSDRSARRLAVQPDHRASSPFARTRPRRAPPARPRHRRRRHRLPRRPRLPLLRRALRRPPRRATPGTTAPPAP